jgi:folate-binding protein YgfZ
MLTLEASEAALRSGSIAAPTTRDIVEVAGPEAASYLHGQLSQNVEQLAEGTSAWTLLLEPTGRVTAWARLTRVADEVFWLDVDAGYGAAMLARLERFKLRTKAECELFEAVPAMALRGPATPAAADLFDQIIDLPAARVSRVVAADLDWPGAPGVDLLGLEAGGATAILGSLGIELGDPLVAELERIETGRPAMGREFGEKTIPAETGVVNRSADFTKGCYVGQELVARIDSRGNNTPRTVYPLRMAIGVTPSAGSPVMLDGEVIGSITSVAAAGDHLAALASIKRGVEVPVTAQVDVDGQSVPADISAVHWV